MLKFTYAETGICMNPKTQQVAVQTTNNKHSITIEICANKNKKWDYGIKAPNLRINATNSGIYDNPAQATEAAYNQLKEYFIQARKHKIEQITQLVPQFNHWAHHTNFKSI